MNGSECLAVSRHDVRYTTRRLGTGPCDEDYTIVHVSFRLTGVFASTLFPNAFPARFVRPRKPQRTLFCFATEVYPSCTCSAVFVPCGFRIDAAKAPQ